MKSLLNYFVEPVYRLSSNISVFIMFVCECRVYLSGLWICSKLNS